MKKYILGIAVIATAAIAGWNYQQNQESVELSDLALENVEALARDEGSGNNGKALSQKLDGSYCCSKLPNNKCTQSPDC